MEQKVINAAKWSVLAELFAKLIVPVTNMILARLLTPEEFGVIATVTMITSFADIFTDAGFQKYLVQHEFDDEEAKNNSSNVAFWTNFIISLFLWGLIFIFRNPLAKIVGNPGLGYVVVVACISLPLTSFSSIQMALFRREFDFKTLFSARIVTVLIPFIITVPLALLTHSYWAMIIGTISINLVNAIILTVKSSWKPKFYYDFVLLKKMLSFSIWTLAEQISIWLTSYVGTFIVGTYMTTYYVGLYKTSMTTVNQIISLITASVTPVLFSALSRTQNNEKGFIDTYYTFQKNVGIFVIPLGTGVYLYRNLITTILLGKQWMEAADFIGLWGLISSVTIVFSNFSSEVYRAKGKPRLSFWTQCLHLIVLIPTLIISSKINFHTLYITRSLVRIQMPIVNFIIMQLMFKISIFKQIKNCFPEMFSSLVMAGVAMLIKNFTIDSVALQLISVIICIIVYFSVLSLFSKERITINKFMVICKNRIFKKNNR